jgi:hypothetical protein
MIYLEMHMLKLNVPEQRFSVFLCLIPSEGIK